MSPLNNTKIIIYIPIILWLFIIEVLRDFGMNIFPFNSILSVYPWICIIYLDFKCLKLHNRSSIVKVINTTITGFRLNHYCCIECVLSSSNIKSKAMGTWIFIEIKILFIIHAWVFSEMKPIIYGYQHFTTLTLNHYTLTLE